MKLSHLIIALIAFTSGGISCAVFQGIRAPKNIRSVAEVSIVGQYVEDVVRRFGMPTHDTRNNREYSAAAREFTLVYRDSWGSITFVEFEEGLATRVHYSSR